MRLFHMDIHAIVPNVVRLALHVENGQTVVFRRDASADEVRQQMQKDTHLTAFFKLCASDANARQCYYHELPERYTWHAREHVWKPRQKGYAIGRVYYASPKIPVPGSSPNKQGRKKGFPSEHQFPKTQ